MAKSKVQYPVEIQTQDQLQKVQNLQNYMVMLNEKAMRIIKMDDLHEQESQIKEIVDEMMQARQEQTDIDFVSWREFISTSDKLRSAVSLIVTWLKDHGSNNYEVV